MGEIVNLRRARKERARTQASEQAQINRAAFGRTKTERATSAAFSELEARRIDGHKRDLTEDVSKNKNEP